MNKQQTETLMGKYYNGETSLEEEKMLFRHYNEGSPSDATNVDQAQFIYFKIKQEENPEFSFSPKMPPTPLSKMKTNWINPAIMVRVAAMLAVGVCAVWFIFYRQYYANSNRIRTLAGEQITTTLPDGTKVWLNGSSSLRYDYAINPGTRTVYMEGEAYFEVYKNSERPFVIHTGKVTTEVLGTSFNLRYYPHESNVELNVISGKVAFGENEKIEVSSGAFASFHDALERITSTRSNDPNAIAWKTKRLLFEDAVMKEVVRDLERYFNVSIEIETPGLLNCHFTGSFHDPDLEEILRVIGFGLNIDYTVSNKKYFLSGQNCATR